MMLRSHSQQRFSFRRLLVALPTLALLFLPSVLAHAQDSEKRGRKYQAPPDTASVTVVVVKDSSGKVVENAAVIFHMVGQEGKGNMEMKTNELGKAHIEVIPIGDTVRLQVIASGYQTFGEDYKIDSDTKDITVRLKRPSRQYSTYEHQAPVPGTAPPDRKQNSTPPPPNR